MQQKKLEPDFFSRFLSCSLAVGLLLLLLLGDVIISHFLPIQPNDNSLKSEQKQFDFDDFSYIKHESLFSLMNKIDAKETLFILFGMSNCNDCPLFFSLLKSVSEEFTLTNLYYLNIDEISEDRDNYSKFVLYFEELQKNSEESFHLFAFQDGKFQESFDVRNLQKENLVQFFLRY